MSSENLNPEWMGILVVDKDPGISSFSVISRLRKMVRLKRIGHCGTLDPFATGVLPVFFGRMTSAVQFLESAEKTYELSAVLGERRDTMDLDGRVIDAMEPDELERLWQSGELKQRLEEEAGKLSGELEQLPPMYSAIKIQGKALYRYARAGIEVEREKRRVHVRILDFQGPVNESGCLVIRATLEVSKGTYIRSWVDDLGEAVGCHAYCSSLRRLRVGPFDLEGARTTEALFQIYHGLDDQPQRMREFLEQSSLLLPPEAAFPQLPRIPLDEREARSIVNGQALPLKEEWGLRPEQRCLLFFRNRCLAIAKVTRNDGAEHVLRTERVWMGHENF